MCVEMCVEQPWGTPRSNFARLGVSLKMLIWRFDSRFDFNSTKLSPSLSKIRLISKHTEFRSLIRFFGFQLFFLISNDDKKIRSLYRMQGKSFFHFSSLTKRVGVFDLLESHLAVLAERKSFRSLHRERLDSEGDGNRRLFDQRRWKRDNSKWWVVGR